MLYMRPDVVVCCAVYLSVCPSACTRLCAGLTLSYNAAVLALADEIGTTPDVSAQQREGRNKMRCGPMECAHSPDRSESDRTERPSNGRRAEGSAVPFVVVRIGAAC